MSSEWVTCRTGDLIKHGVLAIGDGYRAKNSELARAGIPFARAGNIDKGFQFQDADYFPESDLTKVGEKISRPGDVVFTSKGTVGRFAFVRYDTLRFVYSPQLCYWRSLNQDVIGSRFLFYWMQSPEFRIQSDGVKGQTDMADYVSLRDQRLMSLTLPTIDEQLAIARILGLLDDKIELNRQTNQTLEAMASSTFKSWFMDFDPVIAKTDGRRPYGMNADTAGLFPVSFEDSQIGPSPRGWRVATLSELCEINPSRTLKKGQLAPYLDMANMPTIGHFPHGWIERPFGSGMKFTNGDTLVARITPCLENGKTAFVNFLTDGEVGWGSTEYIVLRPKSPLPEVFAYCLARTSAFRDFAIQSMTGSSGRQRVAGDSIKRYLLAAPTPDVASAFGAMVNPLFIRAAENMREASTLAALRDTLLPKLLSGEIRVKQAEKFLEAV